MPKNLQNPQNPQKTPFEIIRELLNDDETYDENVSRVKGLLKEGHDSESGPAVYRYLHNMGIDNYMNVIISICLAMTIAIAIINHPKCKINEELSDNEEKNLMHGLAIWQIGFLAVWYLVNVWVVQRW